RRPPRSRPQEPMAPAKPALELGFSDRPRWDEARLDRRRTESRFVQPGPQNADASGPALGDRIDHAVTEGEMGDLDEPVRVRRHAVVQLALATERDVE